MKLNKKLCLLLFIVQLVLCLSFSASASGNDVTFSLGELPSSAEVGDTITVMVNASSEEGFTYAKAFVEYDKTKLTCINAISLNPDVNVSSSTAGKCVVIFSDLLAAKQNPTTAPLFEGTGALALFTFKVNESAEDFTADIAINVSAKNIYDAAAKANTYTVAGDEKTITVKGSAHAEPKFNGAYLALGDSLAVNFYVRPVEGYSNYTVKYTFNGVDTVVTDYVVENDSKGVKYVFPFTNIAPNKMADTITATLTATYAGEEVVCNTADYSAATYCYNQLGKDVSAELKTLLVDLLNYGAAAQTYTKYNTDALVNAELTDEQKAFGTAEVPVVEDKKDTPVEVENAKVSWKGAALNIKENVCFRFEISAASVEGMYVVIETENSSWIIPSEEFESAGNGAYYVYFSGLNAGQMREVVHATVYSGETAVSNTVAYSIESYVARKVNDVELGDMLVAMIKYGDAAASYAATLAQSN